VYWDATLARLGGADPDIDSRTPSDVLCAAAGVDLLR
jgi:hypothetical protein